MMKFRLVRDMDRDAVSASKATAILHITSPARNFVKQFLSAAPYRKIRCRRRSRNSEKQARGPRMMESHPSGFSNPARPLCGGLSTEGGPGRSLRSMAPAVCPSFHIPVSEGVPVLSPRRGLRRVAVSLLPPASTFATFAETPSFLSAAIFTVNFCFKSSIADCTRWFSA